VARQILKWVGGKVRLVETLAGLLPLDYTARRHVEPFAGGAALFFRMEPQTSLLSDWNRDLITTYRMVREDHEAVLRHLGKLAKHHGTEAYYSARSRFNSKEGDGAQRAALLLYLNRTCFNGVFRVNRKGEFNVSIGDYTNPDILNEPTIRAAQPVLQHTKLLSWDFEDVLEITGANDFVYLDPPYVSEDGEEGFASYDEARFEEADLRRLSVAFRSAGERGAQLALSHTDLPIVRNLFEGFTMHEIEAPRSVSRYGETRVPVKELVVTNY
jgi:DNA adenine methylase